MNKFIFKKQITTEQAVIFTEEANEFVRQLIEKFDSERLALLSKRKEQQEIYNSGMLPGFLKETEEIRKGDWKIKGIPEDLMDRRVEITAPPIRNMIVRALNADVKCYMSDFEDSCSPSWDNIADGQVNLYDAIRHQIDFEDKKRGKSYILNEKLAVLLCRVRGLHLPEKYIEYKGKRIPASFVDFGYYFFHNHKKLLEKGSGPYFYIPKLQSYKEAELWAQVFYFAEDKFQLPHGTIKATVLIETLPAVFQMNEILYSLQDHIVGLNCGRWDYIFSYIKTLQKNKDKILPNRLDITMDKHFLNSYSSLLIQTCHKRGAFAMGGMAAYIPSNNPQLNAQILSQVRDDKTREFINGHDGTWIAHPGLDRTANEMFEKHVPKEKNQLHILKEGKNITANDLLQPCQGNFSEESIRLNIRIALQYIEAWISGRGCVPIYNLMEDAATSEISRVSIWQWIQHGVKLNNGIIVTKKLFSDLLIEELKIIRQEVGDEYYSTSRFKETTELFEEITTSDTLIDFLTLPTYELL